MDLRRVEIFCKIVELKSFTRAAEAVRLAQPTVSEHMRQLEDELGERLLERSGRTIQLTPAGQLFLQYARRMLRTSDEARQALARFRGTIAGKLLIGASTIPGAYLLPAQLQGFKALHPDIDLSLKIASTAQTLDDLLEGRMELALIGAQSRQPQLELIPLATDELILAVNPQHPWADRESIAAEELKNEPFILREEGSGSRLAMSKALQEQGVDLGQLKVVAEMGNSESVRQSVKAGVGAAVISRRAVAEELANQKLRAIQISGVNIIRHIYLARHARRSLTPLAETFSQYLLLQNFD